MYKVASELSLLSSGVYSADLGPDLQDAPLAPKAFGPNGMHLTRLTHSLDPRSMPAHTCPLPSPPREPKLIVFITGDHAAGKDYCANVWVVIMTDGPSCSRIIFYTWCAALLIQTCC